jgi:hypothetical protein
MYAVVPREAFGGATERLDGAGSYLGAFPFEGDVPGFAAPYTARRPAD